uniref:Plasmid stabilization system protein n=1 Tax=Chlorobium chlorochromatii (strain CaD3) TaxID=340177 RepID=Q3ASR8_CHLCH
MAVTLKIHELAHQELLDAIAWYNEIQSGLGKRFQETIMLQIQKIKQHPTWFPRETIEVFKAYVPRFPYKIIYSVNDEAITIWAIAHLHRKPSYWQSREKS